MNWGSIGMGCLLFCFLSPMAPTHRRCIVDRVAVFASLRPCGTPHLTIRRGRRKIIRGGRTTVILAESAAECKQMFATNGPQATADGTLIAWVEREVTWRNQNIRRADPRARATDVKDGTHSL